MNAVRAEWGKLWSVRAPLGCLAGAVLLVLVTATSLANDFVLDVTRGAVAAGGLMTVTEALTPAVQAGLALVVAFAMLPTTSEFGTGSISSTLCAQPLRGRVLHAKAAVAVAVAVPAGLVTALLGRLIVGLVLGGHAGPDDLSPVVLRVGLLFGLCAVLAVGIAAVLRSSIGTLSIGFVLLVALSVLPPDTAAWTPAGAAAEFLAWDQDGRPPGTGMLVLLGWAAAAYGLGWWRFERRDA